MYVCAYTLVLIALVSLRVVMTMPAALPVLTPLVSSFAYIVDV